MKKLFLFQLVLVCSVSALFAGNEKFLDEYVTIGLKNNFDIQSARETKKTYDIKENRAFSSFLPSLAFSTVYTRAGGGRKFEFPLGDMLNPLYQYAGLTLRYPNISQEFILPKSQDTKFEVVQPIFAPAIYHNYNASKEQSVGAGYELRTKAQTLAYSIREAYYQYLQARVLVNIRESALKLSTDNYETIKKLYEADRAPKADLLRAEVLKLSGRQELRSAQSKLTVAGNNFNRLINRDFSALINYDSVSVAELIRSAGEELKRPGNTEESYKTAVELRSEIKQIESGITALGHAEKAVSSEFYPTLAVVGDLGWTYPEYRFNNESKYWTLSLSASWKLFNGFDTKYNTEELAAQKEALDLSKQNTKQLIKLEIANAVADYNDNLEMLEVAAKSYESAKESYRLTEQRYREGMTALLSLVDAQNSLSGAESNYIITYYTILIAKTKLEKAIGTLDADKLN